MPKYKVIPAQDVRPEQRRRWVCPETQENALAHLHAGTAMLVLSPVSVMDPESQARVTHAIVEDVGPRFVVKVLADLAPGEVCCTFDTALAANKIAERLNAGTEAPWPMRPVEAERMKHSVTHRDRLWAICDTNDDWHRARAIKGERYEAIAVDEPAPGPSDAEIVAAYERALQAETVGDWFRIHGGIPLGDDWRGPVIPIADARAAWSRVLAAKVAAARERERRRVAVQIDDASAEDIHA